MYYLAFPIGFIFGIFAFSQIFYTLLYSLPKLARYKKDGMLKRNTPLWFTLITPAIWSLLVIISVWLFSYFFADVKTYYLVGLGIGAFIALIQIPMKNKDLKEDFNDTYGKYIDYEKNNHIKDGDKTTENEDIISAYNLLRKKVPDYNEPNYDLAKKVFLDFNDFNLRNNENGLTSYLRFIPKSLLPYPKNYIKCAYYIFLEKLKNENNLKMFKNVQEIGVSLFLEYPDYEKYKENLIGKNTNGNGKKWIDDTLKDMSPNPKEVFKKIYGVYEISEEDYNSSPNSIDSTDEKLLHDFGVLPEIEDDVDVKG